jgi:hypothetical protein
MDMTTETTKSVRDIVIEEKNRVTKRADFHIGIYNTIEKEYDKFFSEIQELSSDFTLTKIKRVYSQDVNYRHPNGKLTVVDKVSKEWNDCQISFVGKIPETQRAYFNISVEEHKTNGGRRSYSTKNHGFKIKLEMNYSKPTYYKSAKGLIKRINEEIESLYRTHNSVVDHQNKLNLALEVAKKRFPGHKSIDSRNGTIDVYYKNGTVVRMYYSSNLVNCEVNFKICNVITPEITDQDKLDIYINLIGKF